MSTAPTLSVIVPFFNEEQNIQPLYDALINAITPLKLPFELVFVDDGSRDNTALVATQIAQRDERVRLIKFRRNYGQTPAMAAGIEHAHGEILLTMDGDLQNDPADIALFLGKIAEGYDIVVGWRFDRQDKLLSRKVPSRIANWLIGKVTGVPIKDNGCSLKAYRAALIKEIPLYSEMHRFIPAMASIAGPRIAEIKVRHHARLHGKSKYGLSRVYKVLLDLTVIKTVAAFASRPLQWFSLLATPLAIVGTLAIVHSLWRWAAEESGTLTLPVAATGIVLLMAAFNLVCSGVLAELVYKTGDVRERDFSRLTGKVWQDPVDSKDCGVTGHE